MNFFKPANIRLSACIFHVCISLLFVCCFFFSSTVSSEAKASFVVSQPVVASDMSELPSYSALYEKLLSLERKGETVKALQVIPEIYAAEIPNDSFFITLENKRRQLLETVSEKEISFSVGREAYTFTSVRELFSEIYLREPEYYHYMVQFTGELDVKRFCYFMIIEGQNEESTPSRFDIRSALNKVDPWLTSVAIFVSRKQESKSIVPKEIIHRWQSRPDLWDEECTRQSLLFLAQFDSTEINGLDISNLDIRMEVKTLRPVPKDQGYIVPLMFSAHGNTVSYFNTFTGTILQMKNKKNKKGLIKRWAGDTNHYSDMALHMRKRITGEDFTNGTISVEPGFYKLRFNSVNGSPPSGFYGASGIIEVDAGELVAFPISLTPAI